MFDITGFSVVTGTFPDEAIPVDVADWIESEQANGQVRIVEGRHGRYHLQHPVGAGRIVARDC